MFRDVDEQSASPDLSESIKAALRESAHLLVLCAPSLKGSDWCRYEIQEFKRLGRPITALVLAGEPGSKDPDLDPFPPVMREIPGDAEGASDGVPERMPLAIDLRPRAGQSAREARRQALLKVVARLADVPYGDLENRDQRRRRVRRRVIAVVATAVAVAGVLVGRELRSSWRLTEVAQRSKVAVDLAIHAQREDIDPRTALRLAVASVRLDAAQSGANRGDADRALRKALGRVVSLDDRVEWHADLGSGRGYVRGADSKTLAALGWLRGIRALTFADDKGEIVVIGTAADPLLDAKAKPLCIWRPRSDEPPAVFATPRKHAIASVLGAAPTGRVVSGIEAVASSCDERMFVSGGTLLLLAGRLDQLSDPALWIRLPELEGPVRCAAVSPCAPGEPVRVAWAGEAGDARIWTEGRDDKGGAVPALQFGSSVNALCWIGDGTSDFAVGLEDGRVVLVDPIRSTMTEIGAHAGAVQSVSSRHCSKASGRLLASAALDGTVRLWKSQGEQWTYDELVGERNRVPRAVAFDPSGRSLAIGWSDPRQGDLLSGTGADAAEARMSGAVWLADINNDGIDGRVRLMPGLIGGVTAVAFSKDARLIAAGCDDLSVHAWVAPIEELLETASRYAQGELTDVEWRKFIGLGVPPTNAQGP